MEAERRVPHPNFASFAKTGWVSQTIPSRVPHTSRTLRCVGLARRYRSIIDLEDVGTLSSKRPTHSQTARMSGTPGHLY
jgi:hypothetical protein